MYLQRCPRFPACAIPTKTLQKLTAHYLISMAHVRKRVPAQTLITTSAVKIFNVFGFIATTNPPHKSPQSH